MRILDFFKKRPDGPAEYWVALAHERFQPDDLLKQAQEAELAGFDGFACSDHLAPWWTETTAPTSSGNAWVWLGAVAHATTRAKIGPAVTAIVHRYNPVVVAQQIATLDVLAPGRTFLGVGSGEAMNEVAAGMHWPPVEEQLARTEEALTIIARLLDGETVDFTGSFFEAKGAKLYAPPKQRPPVILSAFGEQAAQLAGRLADGLWTLGDPRTAPQVIAAYKEACEQAGREVGPVVVQAVFSYAPTDEQALEQAREWKGTQVDRHYTDDVHDPAQIYRNGEDEVPDELFATQVICSADADTHVKRIKAIEKLGADVMTLMNVSGGDPHAALRFYGERVLPELRSDS
jgi:coenzyme F420-dependent glucose-6-phosphate dehydrogenase